MSGRHTGLVRPGRTAIVAALLLGFYCALTVVVLAHPTPFAVETWWADLLAAHRSGALTTVARAFDAVGLFPWSLIVVALATVVIWRARIVAGVATLLSGEAASWVIGSLTKIGVGRSRPPEAIVDTSTASFPSGHTAFATVTAVLLVGLLCSRERRGVWAVPAGIVAFAMAWSRTYLAAHWLADVAGGLALGGAAGLGALAWRSWTMMQADAAAPPDNERKVLT